MEMVLVTLRAHWIGSARYVVGLTHTEWDASQHRE
jgi:hypothetical protein